MMRCSSQEVCPWNGCSAAAERDHVARQGWRGNGIDLDDGADAGPTEAAIPPRKARRSSTSTT